MQTYEQASALKMQTQAADPIHYNVKYSYRKSKYRHLYHQNGIIGYFKVRLVEAKNLKRWHWSMLGMGPVKFLGLSHAHGQVSSFAVMKLGFRSRNGNRAYASETGTSANSVAHNSVHVATAATVAENSMYGTTVDSNISWENESIASALSVSTSASTSAPSPLSFASSSSKRPKEGPGCPIRTKEYRSSVVKSNSNPSWPTVQSSSNISIFNIPLEKGIMPKDGMEIYLSIQMKEEWSALDSIVPVKSGGDGLLGEAEINLTPLVLRGFGFDHSYLNAHDAKEEIDFLDQWVYLHPPTSRNMDKSTDVGMDDNDLEYSAGKVRIIVSYEPNGFSPRRGDIVALEAFARQSVASYTYRPIIHPSHPLRVRDVRGEYLLCAFDLPHCKDGSQVHEESNGRQRIAAPKEGSIRLHRNTVFVIERTNLVDSAINVALKPADVVLSTPLGKEVTETISPYVEAAGDILMPAVLSTKLFFEAAKVGGSAFAVGLKSAVSSVAESQDPEKRRRMKKRSSSE